MKISLAKFLAQISVNLLTATALLLAAHAQAQEDASVAPKSAVKKATIPLSFTTQKNWDAGRWYAVGKWVQGNGIRWLGGDAATRVDLPAECIAKESPFAGTIERNVHRDESLKSAEVLTSGEWIAIELSPNVQEEEFTVKGPTFSNNPNCHARMNLAYAWSKDGGKVTPLLLLSAKGSRFYGYEVNMDPPAKESGETADITLDLMLGFWPGKIPSAGADSKKTLNFAPVATVRGEWLPLKQYWGIILGLEQTVASFGGVANQKALFSDWQIGTFGEGFLPVADSLQLRGGLRYRQHLADDSLQAPSLLSANKDARYIVASGTANLFFGGQWLVGFDAEYGLPGELAGRHVKQSFLNGVGRLGFRTSTFLYIIFEGGYRAYQVKGAPTESVTMAQLGIRLDL